MVTRPLVFYLAVDRVAKRLKDFYLMLRATTRISPNFFRGSWKSQAWWALRTYRAVDSRLRNHVPNRFVGPLGNLKLQSQVSRD